MWLHFAHRSWACVFSLLSTLCSILLSFCLLFSSLSIYFSICLVFFSVCSPACLPVCLLACLPVCQPACLPACHPACLSVCLGLVYRTFDFRCRCGHGQIPLGTSEISTLSFFSAWVSGVVVGFAHCRFCEARSQPFQVWPLQMNMVSADQVYQAQLQAFNWACLLSCCVCTCCIDCSGQEDHTPEYARWTAFPSWSCRHKSKGCTGAAS